MRKTVTVALCLGLFLSAAAHAEEPLENRLAKDYMLVISANDAGAFKTALEGTGLWALWREEAVQKFLRPALKDTEKSIQEGTGFSAADLTSVMPGQAVLAFAPARAKTRRAEPRGVVLVRLGAAKANADRLLGHIRQQYDEGQIKKGTLSDGTPCEEFGHDSFLAIKDGLLAYASAREVLEEVLVELPAKENRLPESPRYQAAMKPLGARAAQEVYSYVDLASLLKQVEADDGLDTPTMKALETVGADECEAQAWSLQVAGGQFVNRGHLYAPGWTHGLLKAWGTDARPLLRVVPPEAVGAAAMRFDLDVAFRILVEAVRLMTPVFPDVPTMDYDFDDADMDVPATQPALPGAGDPLAELNKDLGVDLGADVIAPLGTDMVAYILPVEGVQVSPLPRMVVEMSVRQPERLSKALDQLGRRLSKELEGGPVTYRRQDTGLVVWHYVESQVPPVHVAVALSQKRLVLGTRQADVAAAVQRAGAPLERSVLDRPEVAKAIDQVGGNGALVAYLDARPVLQGVYPVALPLILPAIAQARGAAGRASCANGLRMLAQAVFQYAVDKNDKMPAKPDDLLTYLGDDRSSLKCPKTGLPYHLINYSDKRMDDLLSDTMLAYELTAAHDGQRNVAFVDGHVEAMSEEAFQKALAKVPANLRAKEPGPDEIRAATSRPADEGPIPGLGPLPSAEDLFRHIKPAAACVKVTGDGAVAAYTSSVNPLALFLPSTAGFWALFAVQVSGAAMIVDAEGPDCQGNLRNVGLAVFMYAIENGDKMPGSLADLKPHLEGGEEWIKCPQSGLQYHLVNYAGKSLEDLAPGAILAYEIGSPHDGKRHVLFVEGHVEAMTAEAFEKAVQALPAELRAKEPTTTAPAP